MSSDTEWRQVEASKTIYEYLINTFPEKSMENYQLMLNSLLGALCAFARNFVQPGNEEEFAKVIREEILKHLKK